MTRREDPNWGDDPEVADADTFHATNAAPQRQRFNAGIWLALEDYVLDNVDQEDIRATVITGPVFRDEDPVYQGVPVPTEFWKIVVYLHPELEDLAAIAYKRSQAKFLPALGRRDSRFVFGDFDDTQVSVASLEEETGLDFSAIREIDVMAGADPGMVVALRDLRDAFVTP
jgi:endonuclease G